VNTLLSYLAAHVLLHQVNYESPPTTHWRV